MLGALWLISRQYERGEVVIKLLVLIEELLGDVRVKGVRGLVSDLTSCNCGLRVGATGDEEKKGEETKQLDHYSF